MKKWTFGTKALGAAVVAAAVAGVLPKAAVAASPYLPNAGFTANALPAEDDSPSTQTNIGFTANFFGTDYTQLWVNNNGNVTFSTSSPTYTPGDLTGPTSNPIIAPFYADVDTRGTGSGVTEFGTDTVNGHAAFGVDWPAVGYYPSAVDKLNTFQMVLIDRNDIAAGDFDIEFNYTQIQWDTGGASGGSDGLATDAGTSAAVGYSSGSGDAGTFAQLTGSFVHGAFIDGGVDSLVSNSNDGVPGQYLFEVRGGQVTTPPPNNTGVPLPSAAWSSLLVLGSLGLFKLARSRRTA